MPSLIRKLVVSAAVNGLIIQSHGSIEHQKAIHIDYKTRQVRDCPKHEAAKVKHDGHLELHGIIGLLSVSSYSYLITITKREQVAQIFGKPVYMITDVAFLPLSTQTEASEAITAAASALRNDEPISDSDYSDSETEATNPPETPGEISASPTDDDKPIIERNAGGTSIVQDVFTKKGQYGQVASQWFSRQGWGLAKPLTQQQTKIAAPVVDEPNPTAAGAAIDSENPPDHPAQADKKAEETLESLSHEPFGEILPKIIRTTRLILCSRSFFFSYDFNLTRRLAISKGLPEFPTREKLDSLYFWNKKLAAPLLDAAQDAFLMPIVQGFVGQRSFVVQKTEPERRGSTCIVSAGDENVDEGVSHAIAHAKSALDGSPQQTRAYLLTLISRRSVKRSGLRYLRRGVDDEGNCANFVETEQILSASDWSQTQPIRSFVQIRGSIPLYFSQSPFSPKPVPTMHQSASTNETALVRHFTDLKKRYGNVQVVALVDKHGGEKAIGEAYESTVSRVVEGKKLDNVKFEWFDFHTECKGMKFENVSLLVDKLQDTVGSYGTTLIENGVVKTTQAGTFRVNCMDCLDRTNVAESAFGQYVLQTALSEEGFEIDLLHDEGTTWFNTLWADNGDAVSRQYAGTAALKGDFTRTRKRNYRGALNDFSLTLSRYYNNMVNDYFSQAVTDVLLGNLPWKIFEDFETEMKSADPGISIANVREAAVESCRKLVVQDESEDLIHGWTMLAPAVENTLRTLPFQEAVVLLTDAAVYCCKFDWTTEKLASFEKIDLRGIKNVRYGTYITSTFSDRQTDSELNAGVVIMYQPGKDSVLRTNTRSMSNQAPLEPDNHDQRIDGGTGILSWLGTRPHATTRLMALKVISTNADTENGSKKTQKPQATAEQICDEIQRAIIGSGSQQAGQQETDLVEKGDIISLAEARRRTGYLEQIGHSIKKLVWT